MRNNLKNCHCHEKTGIFKYLPKNVSIVILTEIKWDMFDIIDPVYIFET